LSVDGNRPLFEIFCDPLSPSALREMWSQTLPQFSNQASILAARFPVEPSFAASVATDLRHLEQLNRPAPSLSDVAASVRTRAGAILSHGVKLVRPTATWDFLVLREDRKSRLREAVNRLQLQSRVLDDWQFLKDRHGARGVRMLFSGPPGTGKTLAAEVIANTLSVDLLIVDLARVVSKWIGESEKNLAEVFETAERAKAVLLFDEADALFGKRTEVSDAHDRYANLETAYLLSRLERFEGLAILSTNLRQNIDVAFTRRLEFIIPFEEPAQDERMALWQAHLPSQAPLVGDVDLRQLASLFPIVGGLIRNASVAAAFLAAADDRPISQQHFVRAIECEYEKIGKPYPGIPVQVAK
jgi:SpoVK/Ycf46/Vps4 family AAA+-type ATPase